MTAPAVTYGEPLRRALTAMALTLVLAGGCGKKTEPTIGAAPEMNPEPSVDGDAAVRSDELTRGARELAELSRRLPGRSPQEHRGLMRDVFANLSQTLRLLVGPEPGGMYRQQLRIIETTREQLAGGSEGLAPEPTIDTGLRGAHGLLAAVGRDSYFNEAGLSDALDRLAKKIEQLDAVRGGPHRVIASDAVALTSDVVTRMADALAGRATDQGAASAPQTQPSQPQPAGAE